MTEVRTRALDELAAALGPDAVLTGEAELVEYRDPYTFAGWNESTPSAVVLPGSVEEVQAVVRIANEHRLPLWTQSQGRNYSYGGPAPRVSGSVVVSLQRMNRVLEVNEELAYALVEPGVRFFDLVEAVRAGNHALLVSVPVLGWGSVVGNTLEYGWGYTRNGDHAGSQCGMEVVLASGDVVRTGMGALSGARTWQTYKRGFGPSLDGLFFQSNLGIVTKLGIWLSPQPERYTSVAVAVPGEDDLEPLADTLRPLLLDGTIQNVPLIMKDPFSGRWGVRFSLYGHEEVVDAQLAVVTRAFSRIPGAEVVSQSFAGGEAAAEAENPLVQVMGGVPGMAAMQVVKLQGGEHGGQLDFSPVTPFTGRDAVALCKLLMPLYERAGFNFGPGIIVTPRSLIFTAHMAFDTTNEAQVRAAFDLYPLLAKAAVEAGYGVYRTHLQFMDLVAEQYDFNEHALRRLNETLKDALDPNGIFSPGKSGIWPRHLRESS